MSQAISFSKLSKFITIPIFTEWLADVAELAVLDSAICNCSYRSQFISQIGSEHTRFHIKSDYFISKSFVDWVQVRNIQ